MASWTVDVDIDLGELWDLAGKRERDEFVADLIDGGWLGDILPSTHDETFYALQRWLEWRRVLGFDPSADDLMWELEGWG